MIAIHRIAFAAILYVHADANQMGALKSF